MPNVIGPSFTVDRIAPPEVARSPMERRRAFWGAVANFVIEAKERELRQGLDRFGNPMHALAQSTIRRRKSAVGPAHAYAPPLTPAYKLSRTRSLFTADVNERATGVVCWWMYDEITGASWGDILEYHRTGNERLPVRDVIGLTPASLAKIKQQALAWWNAYLAGLPAVPAVPPEYVEWVSPATGRTYRIKVTPGGPLPTGVEPGRVTPLPPSRGQAPPLPSETGIPRTMRARYTQVQTFKIGGHTYTLQGGLGVAPPKPPPPAFGVAVPKPKPPKPMPVPKPAPKPAPAKKAVAEQQLGVKFVPSPAAQDNPEYTTVVVDVVKLAADLAGKMGPSIRGRYAEFQRFLVRAKTQGTAIEQPRVYIDVNGQVSIGDGRHRFAVFRDLGARLLPVSVYREQAKEIRDRYGA
jgi:hypothetical protein